MTLQALLRERVGLGPDSLALLSSREAVTFARLKQEQDGLAGYLVASGLSKGDRVAVLVDRRYEAAASILAVSKAGGVMVPVNYRLPRSLLASMMAAVAPRFAIIQADIGAEVAESPGRWGLDTVERFVGVGGGPAVPWAEAVAQGADVGFAERGDESDCVCLAYTSGTTGPPRAAMISHSNIFWNARSVKEALDLGPDDVHLLTFPSYTQPHEFVSRTLACGGPTVLAESIRPKGLIEVLDQFGVTALVTVPRLARALLPLLAERGKPAPLRMVILSSELPTRALFAALQRSGLEVYTSWGSAETAGMALCGQSPDTVGKACPYYEVALEGGEGVEGPGTMRVGGPGVSRAYYGDADEGRDLSDGWFRTGDLARVEAGGDIALVGRIGAIARLADGELDIAELERRLSGKPEFIAVLVRRGFGTIPIAVYAVPAHSELDLSTARRVVGEELVSLWRGSPPEPSVSELLVNARLTLASTLPDRSPLGGRADLVEVEEVMQEVDRQVVTLLNERARLARQIRDIRAKGDLPPFDPGRDEEMLRAALGSNAGPLYDQALERILRLIHEQTFLSD